MVVRHLSKLISAPDGSEKSQGWLRRPSASRAFVRGKVLIIHCPKSNPSGMLGSAETSEAGASQTWVTVSGGDAEFMKTRRSKRQGSSVHVFEKGLM